MPENIQAASIVEETRHRYLTYALSVITSRALPDVRDGLKPVQRRILYTMFHELHLRSDSRYVKCARIVGDVMGKYHPHGDSAIYDALVRLAQDFVLRLPLVDGQGNFGHVNGDPPAAYRYTEAKLQPVADSMMLELRQNTVDMRPTYNGEQDEPVVLPAQFPNLLVNGTSGIAVGMATNIPPHNLADVISAAVLLIDDPDASTANLLDKLKGPDFPLGGKIITDRKSLRKIYEDGTGSIRMQGEWKLEEGKKPHIIITSIPYGVNKGNLESAIGEIIATRQLPHLVGLLDESSEKAGFRIALEMKPEGEPEKIMAYLYKHTTLQENFACNMTCLVPGPDGKPKPERLGLKEMLRYFLDFRFATVKRRFEYELEQLRKRIHILEGFRIIFNDLDRAIKLIRQSEGKADAAEKLMKAFKLDDIQADAILDAQLYRIAQMEIKKILNELKEKKAEAERIEGILRSNRKLWGVIKDELNALGEKFGDRRRTRIALGEETPEFDEEAYIVKENTNVVLTRDGWIKRVGRLASVEGTRVREGDEVIAVAPGSTLDHVIFFVDDGTAYTMRINEVPASSGYGEPLAKFFRLGDQVKMVTAITTDQRFMPLEEKGKKDDPPGPYLLAITSQGMSLRLPLASYRTESNKLGRRYARLAEDDRVVMVAVPRQHKTIFLASAQGRVLHFPIDEINILSGPGKGVIGIKLSDDDSCLGGALIGSSEDRLQALTSAEKMLDFGGRYEITSRAGKGFEAVKRSTFIRVVPPPIPLVDWDEIEGKKPGKNGTLFD
ncbi:MAG: DNA topoisomerase IV subunit A [Planctomycetes bacterium]|nr:DNA topoisomerase IV subunit A [Planctomycetota bacterium]